MSPQIRTVGHGLVVDLDDEVMELQQVCQRQAGLSLWKEGCQIQDDGFMLSREEVFQVNFLGTADHALAQLTAEFDRLKFDGLPLAVPAYEGPGRSDCHAFSRIEVGAAADNLQQAVPADIYLADPKQVRLRVGLNAFDPAGDDSPDPVGRIGNRFNLNRTHGQVGCQILSRKVSRQVDVLSDPIQRNVHGGPLLLELAEKAQVRAVEEADVIDAVAHHDQPVQADVDVKAAPDIRIQTGGAEDIGMG